MIIMPALLIAAMKILVSVYTKILIVMIMMLAQLIVVALILGALTKLYTAPINLAMIPVVILLMDANGPL
jgi:hypothetical protein